MAFKAAVLGLGNIGRFAVESLEIAPDFDCIGVVRRKESLGKAPHELRGVPEFSSMEELVRDRGKPDAVLICSPSRGYCGQGGTGCERDRRGLGSWYGFHAARAV